MYVVYFAYGFCFLFALVSFREEQLHKNKTTDPVFFFFLFLRTMFDTLGLVLVFLTPVIIVN